MGRSGRLLTKHDPLIYELLNDPDYRINPNGTIETLICRTGKRSIKGVWRIAGTNKDGYRVMNYKGKHLFVHRVMLARFGSEQLSPDLMTNHRNGSRGQNTIENLELIPQAKNNLHAFRELRRHAVFGNVRLTWEIVRQIRKDRAELKLTYRQIRQKYGIDSKGLISEIINNKIWIEGTRCIVRGEKFDGEGSPGGNSVDRSEHPACDRSDQQSGALQEPLPTVPSVCAAHEVRGCEPGDG